MAATQEKVLTALRTLRTLISSKKRWTQGRFALDKQGGSRQWNDPEATCFCLDGGMRRAAGGDKELAVAMQQELSRTILRRQRRRLREYHEATRGGAEVLRRYNDNRRRQHRHIRSVVTQTISRVRRAGVQPIPLPVAV